MASGIHIVWGIFRVFSSYNCKKQRNFYVCFVIWSWYFGAIGGSCFAGYATARLRKGNLYVSFMEVLYLIYTCLITLHFNSSLEAHFS